MRNRLMRSRPALEKATLAFLLPGVAGALNASGFFAVGTYTSHMTGLVSRIGDEAAQQHFWIATRTLIFVAAFVAGAATATGLVIYAHRRSSSAYWRPLLLECFLVFIFATVSVGSESRAHINSLQMTSLLCFSMGLQNALVTRLSSARIRTTHLTGVSTDIGIETTHMLFMWLQDTRGLNLWGRLLVFPSIFRDPRLRRLRIHLSIFYSFLFGATVGPVLYLYFGHVAMLLPCAMLGLLAAFDGWFGLTAELAPVKLPTPSEPAIPRVAD